MTKLDSVLKSKDITLLTKVLTVKTGFSSDHVWNGEGNGIPLQYSFLENPMDRGAW